MSIKQLEERRDSLKFWIKKHDKDIRDLERKLRQKDTLRDNALKALNLTNMAISDNWLKRKAKK